MVELFAAAVFACIAGMIALVGSSPEYAVPWVVALLIVVGAGFFRVRPPFKLRINLDGIEHRPSGIRISYAEITGVGLSGHALIDRISAREANYFLIIHTEGVWRLPYREGFDRLAFYQYLLSKTRLLEAPTVLPGKLDTVRARESTDFSGQVLSSAGRLAEKGEPSWVVGWWVLATALIAGGVTMSFLGKSLQEPALALYIIGGIAGLVAMTATPLLALNRKTTRKMRAASGIVISPRGLTLERPDLKGALHWGEIRRVGDYTRKITSTYGITIEVEGSSFWIADDYVCPLTEIHRLLVHYLSHERK